MSIEIGDLVTIKKIPTYWGYEWREFLKKGTVLRVVYINGCEIKLEKPNKEVMAYSLRHVYLSLDNLEKI